MSNARHLLGKGTAAILILLFALFVQLAFPPLPSFAAEGFSVAEFAPKGLVRGPATIRIVFDREMVKSDDVGRSLEPDELPMTISPALTGTGKWLNGATFVYQPPSGYLAEATEYTLTLAAGLKDADGGAASGETEFRFSTPALEFRGVRQVNFSQDQNFVDYQLLFSLPVNPSRLDGFLTLRDEKGERVRLEYLSGQPSTAIGIRVAGDASPLLMEIARGLTSTKGPLGLRETASVKVESDLSLRIRNSYVQNNYDGAYIYMETTGQVDVDKAKSFVELTPASKFSLESYSGTLRIRGDFQPRDRVTVTLKKGLPLLKGPGLAADWTRSFIFPDLDPSVSFSAQGRFISPANEALMLPLTSVNIEKLDVVVRRVYDNNVPIVTRGGWPYYVGDMSEEIFRRTYQVSGEPNERMKSSIDLKKILGGRKGLFEVYAGKQNDWQNASRMINVTDIAGTAKIYEKGVLIWANAIRAGAPVPGVTATVYSRSHQVLAEGVTDENGLWHYRGESAWKPNLFPDLVVLKKDDDISVLRLDSGIWQYGDIDLSGMPYAYGQYLGMCYTPRGVFRPGESVPVQLLIRERDLAPSKPFPVQLKVYTPLGRIWKTATLNLSEFGMASELVQLSDASPTGTWRISVQIPGEEDPIATGQFLVEDFAPPRISVETSSDKTAIRAGEDATLFIFSEYLFGAPADNLAYEVELTTIPRKYYNVDWSGYHFSDDRTSFVSSTAQVANGNLSDDGTAEMTFPVPSVEVPSILDLAVRVGVMEDGGRWVYRSLTLPYYPRKVMMGILSPTGTIATDTRTSFGFAAIDTDGKRADVPTANVTLYRRQTHSIVSTEGDRRRTELRTEYIPVEGYENRIVSLDVEAPKMEITFETGGYYLLAAEDPSGDATAALGLYVYDARWNYGDEATLPESLNITTDKPLYKAGEKATVRVDGSFEGRVLLSVETDEVLLSQVGSADKSGAEFTFEVTEAMAPNAWITAHLVRPALPEESWAAHRAFGAVPIELDCSQLALSVDITPPERVKTWTVNEFSLKLSDAEGRGVKGEVALMLVDEGVLSLTRFRTPDFLAYYMSRRGLSVSAYDIYADLMPLYLENPNILTPGGGGMEDEAKMAMAGASLSPVKADRFKILTLWKRITTDEDGHANFSFTLPEFSGRARLMAVAAAGRSFGSSEMFFEVARDVVAELALPRALAPGDIVESAIQLFNRSGKALDADLDLQIEGPLSIVGGLDDAAAGVRSMEKKVSLSASASAHVLPLYLRADDTSGVVKLTLTARFPGDAIKETVELPVRPPYPRITRSDSLAIPPGESREVNVPSDWFPGTRRALLSVAGLPEIELMDAARFLITYPYYCLEQTVSGGWALLSQPDLAQHIDPNLATREQLALGLEERIRRIQSLQMYHGGFSPWPRSAESNWSSVYATHFLIACDAKGVPVPRESLNAAVSYLEQLVAVSPNTETDHRYGAELALRAYICYVLSLRGDPPLSWMSYLQDNLSFIPQYGRILLAAAYARAGERETARNMLGDRVPPVLSYEPEREERFNFDSSLRDQSLYLLAWNETDPTGASAMMTAAELLQSLKKAGRYTTQEAGFAMPALADFFAHNRGDGKAELEVYQDGQLIQIISGDKTYNNTIDSDTSRFTIKNTGSAPGFASWTADGVPVAQPEPEDRGLRVRVEYRDARGQLIGDGSSIPRGSRISGTIYLTPMSGTARNLVVSLPLAGGLEIENPNLMDAGTEEGYYGSYYTSRSELRDDRLLLFVDDIGKEFKWTFSMRAVTPGRFILPPIAAEGMYSPGTRSISRTGSIIVTR